MSRYIKQSFAKYCKECNKLFGGSSNRIYCSKQCAYTSQVERQRLKIGKKIEMNKIKLNKKLFPKNARCIMCNKKLNSFKWQKKKYCSNECKHKHKYILKPKVSKICFICKKEYFSNKYNSKFCSKECFNIDRTNKYINDKQSIFYNIENSFYKLRFELLKRDNFTCQYCGRNPKHDGCKLVIDHIIPRNKGGTNEITNLITSCVECNLGKSDVLLEEHKLNKKVENKNE